MTDKIVPINTNKKAARQLEMIETLEKLLRKVREGDVVELCVFSHDINHTLMHEVYLHHNSFSMLGLLSHINHQISRDCFDTENDEVGSND